MNDLYNQMFRLKADATDRNARAQENMAASQAAGQVGSARAQSEGNVLSNLWSQPANFGNILGSMFGGYGAGLGNLGQSYGGNYSAYAQGLAGLGNSAAQERSNLYGSNAMAEAARQGAVSNIGSAALGAFGASSNAAMNAYAAQQDAYNRAMADAITANQGALSTFGQSQNSALSGLGQAQSAAAGQIGSARSGALGQLGNSYGMLGGAAAQLGAAGLGASRQDQTSSSTDQMSQQQSSSRDQSTTNQRANSQGSSYGQQDSNVNADFGGGYGGGYGVGYGGGGFNAAGPSGSIASGSYGSASPYGVGGYASGYGGTTGGMTGRTGSEQSSTGSSYQRNDIASEENALQRNRTDSRSYGGPQMDAFRSSLGTGSSGIYGSLAGLSGARRDLMDNSALNATDTSGMAGAIMANPMGGTILSAGRDGMNRLDAANNVGRFIPSMMLNQTLSGLYGLGGQGYANSNRGMDQYYANTNAAAAASPLSSALAGLTLGYGDVQGRTDDLAAGLGTAYGDATQNVNDIYQDGIGDWMRGRRDPRNFLLPMADLAAQVQAQQDKKIALERAAASDAAREAQWYGDSPAYLLGSNNQILRNTGQYRPSGYQVLTGNQAASNLLGRGVGRMNPVADYRSPYTRNLGYAYTGPPPATSRGSEYFRPISFA